MDVPVGADDEEPLRVEGVGPVDLCAGRDGKERGGQPAVSLALWRVSLPRRGQPEADEQLPRNDVHDLCDEKVADDARDGRGERAEQRADRARHLHLLRVSATETRKLASSPSAHLVVQLRMEPNADKPHPHDKADKVYRREPAARAREQREAEEGCAVGAVYHVVFPEEEARDEEHADDKEDGHVWGQ